MATDPTADSLPVEAPARVEAVVLAAARPDVIAAFWATALRWRTRPADAGAIRVEPTDVTRFHLLVVPATVAKSGQNRIHFDLTTASHQDQASTVDQLRTIGGRDADVGQDPNDTHDVLADPEGNEFCVIEPTNRFLATCPRLGAVNCDGTRALGYFYRDALGWPLVWDENEETAIQAPDETGPKITWSGPPLMPRLGTERFHVHLAPAAGCTRQFAIDQLLALGAARREVSLPEVAACAQAVPLVDVDGNAFCLVDA